jgi:hypothetical protein
MIPVHQKNFFWQTRTKKTQTGNTTMRKIAKSDICAAKSQNLTNIMREITKSDKYPAQNIKIWQHLTNRTARNYKI